MANNDTEYPIPHKNFICAVDKEFIDSEDVNIQYLDEAKNLFPFRKKGSLVLPPGFIEETYLSSIIPTNWYVIDYFPFKIDRDSTEIKMVVISNGTQTKFYVDKIYNPNPLYSNYNSAYPAEAWTVFATHGWIELTEIASSTISVVTGTNEITVVDSTFFDKNLQGWFLVNHSISDDDFFGTKYNMIISNTDNVITLKEKNTGYNYGDTCYICRFPVAYLYKMQQNQSAKTYSVFNAVPTSFLPSYNELRIGCGKDNRPLLLQMLYKKEYLLTTQLFNTIESGSSDCVTTATIKTAPIDYTIDQPAVSETTQGKALLYYGITVVTDHTPDGILDGHYFENDPLYSVGNRITPFTFSVVSGVITITNRGKYKKTYQNGSQSPNHYIIVGRYPTSPDLDNIDDLNDPAYVELAWGIAVVDVYEVGLGYSGTSFSPAATVEGSTLTFVIKTVGDSKRLNYDGLWFDFAQPPQELLKSQVSAFGKKQSGAIDSNVQFLPANGVWTTTSPADGIKFTYINLEPQVVDFVFTASSNICMVVRRPADGTIEIRVSITGITFAIFMERMAQQSITQYGFVLERTGTTTGGFASTGSNWNPTTFQRGTGLTNIPEANDNTKSTNLFLGSRLEVLRLEQDPATTLKWKDVIKSAFILTLQVDRTEVVLSHGFCRPGQDVNTVSTERGFSVYFNSWMSRRLIGMNLYIKQVLTITDEAANFYVKSKALAQYPYFQYVADLTSDFTGFGINEIPLLSSYSIKKFNTQIGSSDIPIGMNPNESENLNYTYDNVSCLRQAKFYDNSGITGQLVGITTGIDITNGDGGEGMKFIVNTNRFLENDITMNYTYIAYIGQVNGRYFIAGCKNEIEKEKFENDDIILYNSLCAGVSAYDQFLRESQLQISGGDTDIIRGLFNHKGYLLTTKDTNVFALDTNTSDDVRYRIVDTLLGCGNKDGNGVCFTPYGYIMPSDDSIYMLGSTGGQVMLTPTNGKLQLYRNAISQGGSVNSIYYPKYKEVYVFINLANNNDCWVFVYSFIEKTWAYMYLPFGVTKARINLEKDIQILCKGLKSILKISELRHYLRATLYNSNVAKCYDTVVKTHDLPYSQRIYDVLLNWVSLYFDYTQRHTEETASIELTFSIEGGSSTNIITYSLYSTSNYYNLESIVPYHQASSLLSFKITTAGLSVYSLNSFYLWVTQQAKKRMTSEPQVAPAP